MSIGIIYIARNKVNGKSYIGQTTKSLEERRKEHFQNAHRTNQDGYQFRYPFVSAIRKYGIDNFEWEVLYSVPEISLGLFEIWAIAKFGTYIEYDKGYNATLGGECSPMSNPDSVAKMAASKKGKQQSVESKLKRSLAEMGENNPFFGKCHSDETKRKISEANSGENSAWFGKKHTEEEKKKISEANKNKPKSEEHKRKLSEVLSGQNNHNFGKTFSQETREKMSAAQSGEKHPMFGKKHSMEAKEKMSKSRKGKNTKLSEEQMKKVIEMYQTENYSMKKLAKIFCVSSSTICRIITGLKVGHNG